MLTEKAQDEEENFLIQSALQLNQSISAKDINESVGILSDKNELLNIKTTLIIREETKTYGNRLIEEVNYEKAGSNGVFEANPKIVKIKGFELNKKTTVKIQLINKSKFSQRVTILPTTTPFFKIKYSRKGQIAPGLSEVIHISFTPQAYVYYNDYIRIVCEGDKMIIPIHAFPKMNFHMEEYVPKSIDFGTVPLNTHLDREIVLKNIIDVPFEYEIVPVKICSEIKMQPVEGLIEAFSNKVISFKFLPQSYGFFRSEYEFRLSEMDYQPVLISVTGSCNVFEKVLTENIIKHMKRLKDPNSSGRIKNTQKISIDKEIESENFQKEEILLPQSKIINIQDIYQTDDQAVIGNTSVVKYSTPKIESSSPKGLSKKFKNFPSNKEREFLNHFNTVEMAIKDKEIKYKRFVGKKLLTEFETNKIIGDRIKDFERDLMIKRKMDINRHSFELDSEKCCVDRNLDYLQKPTFDFNKNDKFFKTRHYYNVLLKNMTKVLITNRADKRLKKLKDMISKNSIKNVNDFAEYVDRDWSDQFSKDSEGVDSHSKLKFVRPELLRRGDVFISYDLNIESLKQEVKHENNINLDELREYQFLERSEIEVMGYKEFKSAGITQYEFSTVEKTLRTCGENEDCLGNECGDSEMTFNKLIELIKMPESYKNHITTKTDTLLFNNPSLKKYAPYNSFPETSLDYNLQPRSLPEDKQFTSNYSNELYNKLSLSIYDNIAIKDIDHANLIEGKSFESLPKKMHNKDERDLYIKSEEKVDEDNYIFNMTVDDESKLINEFEQDDEVIKEIRKLNSEQVFDIKTKEKIKLENYLQSQKRKWMATIPTVLQSYNLSVANPNNKFIL